MKLYATITSERAKQGKAVGGQEWINIIIRDEFNDVCKLEIRNNNNPIIKVYDISDGMLASLEHSIRTEKAKRQKGEKYFIDELSCIRCGSNNGITPIKEK